MTEKLKILFIHNTAMWYRIPFFKQLALDYDLHLVFTHFDVISSIYNSTSSRNIKGLEDVNYTILENDKKGNAQNLDKILKDDYDVIIGGSWDSIAELKETIKISRYAHKHNIPFIIWREDWDWKRPNNIKQKILDKTIKHLTQKADQILVPGSIHKQYFQKLGVKPENITIMPNVSNIKGYNPDITQNTDVKTILYVGRLIKRKGVIYLIKAFKKLHEKHENVKLIIVGEGDEEKTLKKYIKDHQIPDITFTGKIPNNQLKDYYQMANLVVVPSTDDEMGDPWVFILNEAMYYSNPVIATDAVGAAYDMIEDNGYMVKQRNPDELYIKMDEIISNPEIEESMSKKSKEIIDKKYQYKNMINAFNDAVKKVKKS
ncbi:glycosyltransferase family 4 protein [Methanosphaera cuniculi]|uniref:glycosyltransferase family 4 protein n=1 Tax=Methanosphaera cuniculi TaxID=1077256 RepID=UPI0026F0BB59|nr:glycosyltransferase family 4 protein [Methanosphaera cuniculi]